MNSLLANIATSLAIGLIFIARLFSKAFGIIAILAIISSWLVSAPFAMLGLILMKEKVQLNANKMTAMIQDVWLYF